MTVWVPDVGNGGDRLAALARWQAAADEAVAADIIASTRVMRSPGAVPDAEPSAPPPSGPGAPPAPAVLPPAPVVPGGDPAGWLRHFAGLQVSFAAPPELQVATHDPTEGANVSLNGKTFEVHVYLSPDGVRSVAAQGEDTVTSESIVVDGPQGQLHRWHRASGGRPGRPFELELQSRLTPDVHLSVFASCQTAAACGTAETILRSIRVVQQALGILDGAPHHPHSRRRDRSRSHRGRRPHPAGVGRRHRVGDARRRRRRRREDRQTLPQTLLDSIVANKVALKGPVTTPVGEGFTSVNVGLRKALELYANLRPVYNLPGVPSRFQNVDLVIVRENTEDLYAGLEHRIVPGVVESLKIITAAASERIASFAFEYARANGRKKVTAVHKANIMKLSDGLFLESVRKIAKGFPEIPYDEKIVDNACMQLVMRPEQFDVIVLPNLYGDIVSDLCAGLVGGLGVVPGANIGVKASVFEAVHGSAPDIAGQDLANPTALLLSA